MSSAADHADAQVAAVREDPAARLALMASLYEAPPGRPELHLPYRRAALAFMAWELRRGLLRPVNDPKPGSPWWRAINERLLRDTAEARGHLLGLGGPISCSSVVQSVEFARHPSVRTWYRAHNTTIVQAYLDHRDLAEAESRVERFFINLVLIRVLYAHALVAVPRLAMSWLWPVAPLLGDPRLTVTGIFMSLSRVLPDKYPLRGDLQGYISNENRFSRLLDIGVIVPRIGELYAWSARELAIPETSTLVRDSVPAYAWDYHDTEGWHQKPRVPARALRNLLPAHGSTRGRTDKT
ncbi:hypothetical protein U8D42_19265 [Mycobacterium europaeum]|uniref:hypothetical protein n=1 Tax=Mycobacterium europaeum TaxID=761804 RepID=UPI002ADF0566|nr:hypothetical protein [Mycobacterium europaeum]MEA1158506.1 hypothetical protein [Mycobacterium europaeum]